MLGEAAGGFDDLALLDGETFERILSEADGGFVYCQVLDEETFEMAMKSSKRSSWRFSIMASAGFF